jgi:hypothetical protein
VRFLLVAELPVSRILGVRQTAKTHLLTAELGEV